MRKLKVLFLVCFWLSLHFSSTSQISVTPTAGCLPGFIINFSSPPGVSNWLFGDSGSSSNNSGQHIYTTPGVFVVTLNGTPVQTVTVSLNTITGSMSYTLAPSGCLPRAASFQAIGGPSGSQYDWSFGDIGLGTGSSTNYTYTVPGIFYVTLSIKDLTTQCVGTFTNGPIYISAPPSLSIEANPGFGSCQAPFVTAFSCSNSTTGSPLNGGLTYNWNFGNSQTSTQVNSGNITYGQGVFIVSLTGTDNNNCANTVTTAVTVVQPSLSVTGPSVICILGQEPASMQNYTATIQSSQSSVICEMGNSSPFPFSLTPGAPTTFTYPLYTTPGIKTVTFTASSGTCLAVVTQTFLVEEVTADFTTSAPNYTCSPTLIKAYTNLSTVNSNSPLTYKWEVDHWNKLAISQYTTNVANPTFTFTQGSLNPYTMYKTYAPRVFLIATSQNGCMDRMIHQFDSIHRPTAWFNMNKSQGCSPLSVRFRDSSDTYTGVYPIQSYTWNNGATPASTITGTMPPPNVNPTFTYSSPGIYYPFLTISTAGGCTDVSFTGTVTVVAQPTIDISFPPDLDVCAGEPVTFSLSAVPQTTNISHWHIETDNGYYSGCVSNPIPTWPFTHIGTHTLLVSGSDHGCTSQLSPTTAITVNGPVGKFRYRTNCTNKKSVDFFTFLQNAETATLAYGDGGADPLIGSATGTVLLPSTHIYTATGNYTAILESYNSITGCSFTYSTEVTVREINAAFTTDNVVCRNGVFSFSASASTDVLVGCGRGYAWFIDDHPPYQTSSPTLATDNMGIEYENITQVVGIHTITLWVKDINACTSTLSSTFRVASPDVDFAFGANPFCSSANPLQISNLTSQTPDAVTIYTIDYGTGAAPEVKSPADWPIFNGFPADIPSSTFTVMVIGETALGCRDTMKHVLKVNNPYAYIIPSIDSTCVNVLLNFSVAGGYTNTVNFGDGPAMIDPSGVGSYTHAFASPGTYSFSINVVDDGNCSSTASGTLSVEAYPVANFTFAPVNPEDGFCAPAQIQFSSTGVSTNPISKYDWDFGTGPMANAAAGGTILPVGVKVLTLTVYTANGCSSTISKTISVVSPSANPYIARPAFCLGETVQVGITDMFSVGSWSCGFNGNVIGGTAATPLVAYNFTAFPEPSGSATLTYVYFDADRLCRQDTNIFIKIIKVDPDFSRNLDLTPVDYEHCLNITDQFTNKSKVNNSTFMPGANYLWGFGNGVTSTLQSASYTYPNPGVYSVTLAVTEAIAGCINKTVKNMTINPLPTVSISVIDSVCSKSTFTLYSSGSSDITEYNWLPESGVTSPHSAVTTVIANTSTGYSMTVVNRYGCKAASNNVEYVFVQQPPIIVKWDTTIIVGQMTNLNTFQGPGYTYSWSPLTDLSCSLCPYPVSSSTVNITYSVEVTDPMACFKIISTYSILVDPQTSIDVPTAFTPNGDGVNDVIYVDGWGIKKLNYFRIFNRWGQLLFESYDVKTGWDGTFKGVPQNMETYIYQVSADTYLPGKSLEKTSSFRLIR